MHSATYSAIKSIGPRAWRSDEDGLMRMRIARHAAIAAAMHVAIASLHAATVPNGHGTNASNAMSRTSMSVSMKRNAGGGFVLVESVQAGMVMLMKRVPVAAPPGPGPRAIRRRARSA